MLKITVIIFASIISAVILQDVNHFNKEPCSKQSAPAVEKQAYMSNPSQSLTQENYLYRPKVYELNEHEQKVYEPKEYEPKLHESKVYELNEHEQKVYEPKEYEPKLHESKVYVPKDHEPKAYEPKYHEPKVYEPKDHEPKVYEPKDHESKVYEPKDHESKVYEPKIYESNPEKYDEPPYYNNRRKSYPNPILIQPTSDEIVEKTLRRATDCLHEQSQTNDLAKELQPLDTRRFLKDNEGNNDYQHDNLLERDHSGASSEESVSNEMEDPLSRGGVSMVDEYNKPLLLNNPRVCYACSSATNPTCWEPNRRTTIKYCRKDHASCITKTFGEGNSLTLIRDCAASCSDSSIPGLQPKYNSCKVCHSDLCNSAFSIKSYTLLYVLLFFTALKFTF